jgi:outer membrane receptor protein involved in Fe transport
MNAKRILLMAGVSALALSYNVRTASAQAADSIETVTVTGSLISRPGYQAPTPLTVLGANDLLTQAPANIADAVTKLPAVNGSNTNQNTNQGFSAGTVGIVALNLRNLGTTRTLVLLDGQRSVPSAITGIVDVNTFPQELISRVDVVTGGASAVYGSDALAGVVNFILDKTYTGIKGEVSGGITTYSDDANWKTTLTMGTGFSGGRGHLLFSGSIDHIDGIFGVPRKWDNTGRFFLKNPNYTPTNGQPQNLILSGAGFDTATPGGIITSGPLKGTAFGPGGTPYQFDYGTLQSDPVSVGGSWATNQVNQGDSLDQKEGRQNVFARASYDLTDNINVYMQGSYTQATTFAWDVQPFSFANYTISASNPFLPPTVAARAAALKVTSFTMGTFWGDLPPLSFKGVRNTSRAVVGASGTFGLFGNDWKWNAYYQLGFTASSENGYALQTSHSKLATDAVINPATGSIICRDTLTNPTDGCVPFNIFGTGVNSPAAIRYVDGSGNLAYRHQGFTENVISGTVSGEPFSDWAGPVSLAFGVEHRRESVKGFADPDSAARDWYSGNYLPTIGSFSVTEGSVETVVPVLDGLVLDIAARETDYSTSGMVTTYKVGAEYSPIDDIRFRVTRSRDIRAPNLSELFAAGTAGTNNIFDGKYNKTYSDLTITTGNPALKPEVADTTNLGFVVTPTFLTGFAASVDYYNIHIRRGVGSVNQTQIVANCVSGQLVYCAAITRDPVSDLITIVRTVPFNLAAQIANGIDFEASYNRDMADIVAGWDGSFGVRALATHYMKNYSDNGLGTPTSVGDSVGQNDSLSGNTSSGPPNWVYQGTLTYTNHPYTVSLTGRGLSAGIFSNSGYGLVACTSGCPASTATAPTANTNHVPGAFYIDTSVTYDYGPAQFFLAVKNVLNTDPPILPSATGVPNLSQTNLSLYDVLGRTYRMGIRFSF